MMLHAICIWLLLLVPSLCVQDQDDPGIIQADPDCPCIDTSSLLAQSRQTCVLPKDKTNTTGVYVQTVKGATCYPLTYGAGVCATHDASYDPACRPADDGQTEEVPAYCHNAWCFVDLETCRQSRHALFRSRHWVDRDANYLLSESSYYSYSTCGSSADDWLTYDTTQVLAKRTLRIALPVSIWPLFYKPSDDDPQQPAMDREGPEYWNDRLPWKGWVLDFFDAVVDASNIPGVEYTSRSRGSLEKGYTSVFTQTVTDVYAGISDMALGPFWVTEERLALTPYTVPVTTDTFTLWIPQPDTEPATFRESARKLLMPFSTGLWLGIIGTVLAFGILSALVSPRQFQNDNDGDHHPADGALPKRKRKTVQTLANSIYASVLDIMGGALGYDVNANASKKVIDFGFAIFVFVVVSAYTANLAAFLTLSGQAQYISSIEQAISARTPLCASPVVRSELQDRYPQANWVFYDEGTSAMVEAYDKGLCAALVQGWIDVRGSPNQQKLMCDRHLVRVGNTVLEKPIAFPVNKNLGGGISHWLAAAQGDGTRYEDFLLSTEPVCSMEINLDTSVDDGLPKLELSNMVLPFFIFGLCTIVALSIPAWTFVSKRSALRTKNQPHDNRDSDMAPARSFGHMTRSEMSHSTAPSQKLDSSVWPPEQPIASRRSPSNYDVSETSSMEDPENSVAELYRIQQQLLHRMQRLERQSTGSM